MRLFFVALLTRFSAVLLPVTEIEYEEVFIDGTKIESMANRYTFVWRKSVDKQLAKVKAKAKELFYGYGGEGNLTTGKLRSLARSLIPEGGEMVHGTGRRKPFWQRQYEEIDQLLERWKKYETQLFEMGCRRNSLSKTDKDATFMRMKEDHMGNGQLKPAYNVQLAVNSEYITGVAAFPNCTDSGTLMPFLNHIQRMQGRSYRDIVADAGYESVGNYLYLQAHGQNGYIKPTNYEIRKTRKYKQQIWRMENMQYLQQEDCFVCAAHRKLRLHRTCSKKEGGIVTTCSYYRCEGCGGCPLREQCTKSRDGLEEQIEQFLAVRPDTGLVVIDTLQKVRTGDANGNVYACDYRDMSALKSLADRYNIGILLVHHQRKDQTGDPFDDISGSVALMGGADTSWVLRRRRMSLNAQLHVTGRDMESRALDLRWADCRWELEQEETSEELARKAVPACVWTVADFVKRQKFWQGTATELLAAAGITDIQPNQLTRKLVEFYPTDLAPLGIRCESHRTANARQLRLWYDGDDANDDKTGISPDCGDTPETPSASSSSSREALGGNKHGLCVATGQPFAGTGSTPSPHAEVVL